MYGILKNETYELMYKTEIDSQTENKLMVTNREGRDKLEINIHTTVFKIDNQQEPTVPQGIILVALW